MARSDGRPDSRSTHQGGAVRLHGAVRARGGAADLRPFREPAAHRERLIHVRWSGEACWIPLGALDLGLGYENATSFPAPGQILLYPGGISETEILFPYGAA